MDRPDEEWVAEARHDPEAFAELVRRYQGRIYALARRLLRDASEAEDVTQETFLRAYRALDTFQLTRRFSPWLFRIATNLCLDLLRARRPWLLLDPGAVEIPAPQGVERSVEAREQWRALEQALQGLSSSLRTVFLLRYEAGLSYEEIAQTLGVPLNTVRTRLYRAREQLRVRMQGWL